MNWIPVTERMPEPDVPVLVFYEWQPGKHFWSRATWVPKHTVEAFNWDGEEDFLDWDETGNYAYWPEGWYEYNNDEEVCYQLKGVTHWAAVELPNIESERTQENVTA